MESDDAIITLLYAFFSFIFIAPPAEVVSAGITIENMFGFCLGQESHGVIHYHMRRTTLFRFLHSLVFPGYFITKHWFSVSWKIENFSAFDWITKAAVTLSIAIPLCIAAQCYIWWKSGWDLHPIAINIRNLNTGGSWRDISNVVNMEFRAIDKFLRRSGSDVIIATENWVIKMSRYSGWVVHQSDIRLEVAETDQHDMTVNAESDLSVTQYLRITVHSQSRRKPVFNLRVLSSDFEELRMKTLHPIEIARNVVLVPSVEERFLCELKRVASSNPVFNLPPDMESDQCIGCLQKISDVKLVKTCSSSSCQSCFCRPMWCFDCLARWFASQQRQRGSDVTSWMSQQSTCPTCRSVFCVLDVCLIADNNR